jgi:ABC-type lipoprotein release transport system permease subunit
MNQIMALECRCAEAALVYIRKQVQTILPETHVIRDQSKADARARQRQEVASRHRQIVATQKQVKAERAAALAQAKTHREKIRRLMTTFANVTTPLVVLAAAIWVGLLTLSNVRERRTEIGILRALGKGSGTIIGLFLGRAVLLGFLGAGIGFALGTGIGLGLGTELTRWVGLKPLYEAARHFTFPYSMLWVALLGAPLLSAVASYLPTLSALLQDPAVVLRDQ